MAALSVLKPEEEFASARKIESEEHDLWTHLLGYPQLVEPVIRAAESELESKPRGIAALRRGAKAAAPRGRADARRRYAKQAAAMAKAVYEQDVDRRALFAVMSELTKLARGDRDRQY